jgi:hypothetical protein
MKKINFKFHNFIAVCSCLVTHGCRDILTTKKLSDDSAKSDSNRRNNISLTCGHLIYSYIHMSTISLSLGYLDLFRRETWPLTLTEQQYDGE